MTSGSADISLRELLLVPDGPPAAAWHLALKVALATTGRVERLDSGAGSDEGPHHPDEAGEANGHES